MGYLVLLYIALTVTLLFYCYRSIFRTVVCCFGAVFAKWTVEIFLILPLVSAAILKSFLGGMSEEVLRTLVLNRFGKASNIHLAIGTGLFYAGVENWDTFAGFMGPHFTANLNFASVVEFYNRADSSVLLLFSVSIEPFLRLLGHTMLVFTGLEALSSRKYGIWAGVVLLHGMLNIAITYLMGIEKVQLALLVVASVTGMLVLINFSKLRSMAVGDEGGGLQRVSS